jgi:hypothetical protein
MIIRAALTALRQIFSNNSIGISVSFCPMLLVNSGMPTGQAVQRRLQPLTTSTQNSMTF